MRNISIILIVLLFCWGGYELYIEDHPHYDCETLIEIPIEFEDYTVDQICSGIYKDSIGPYSQLRVSIIGDLPSEFRIGNQANLIIHKGSIAKFGLYPHCLIEFKGKNVKLGYYTIYIYGYKNGKSQRISLEEIISYGKKICKI